MKRLKNELNALVNRGVDRHLRLAVTGLSRSGKTAFITAMVNQLLNIHAGARLPLLSAVREERLLGVKRIPQRDFGIPRFTYDEGLAQLYGDPPAWPTPTRGVSEIRLALRYKSNDSLLRHFKDTSTAVSGDCGLPWRMVARPADAGAGLFKLVAPDDGLTQWSARRMVGEMANDVRRAGPASACRRKPAGRHCRRVDRLSPPL